MRASKRLREEAADLLACLASQHDHFDTPFSCPGRWSWLARETAREVLDVMFDDRAVLGAHSWNEIYAEAEARLREGWPA